MPWTMEKVEIPAMTGKHTVQVPEGGKIMGASGGAAIEVIYMVPDDGGTLVDADFEIVKINESLPSYDKHEQHILGVVEVGDFFCVFECMELPPPPES